MGGRGAPVVVVGAGIVGLAAARELAERGHAVLVLEAEDRIAAHQSGHNSGVVHSGLYYRPGSAKARLCVAGREALERFCAEEGVAHRRTGKLVLATDPGEILRLDELAHRGRANGLVGLERLDAGALRERFPDAGGFAGLWVPQTGVVDFPGVARALARRLETAGGAVRTRARVVAVETVGNTAGAGRPTVEARSTGVSPGARPPDVRGGAAGDLRLRLAGGEAMSARFLVNCAGLQADRVARLAGARPDVRIAPFRGDYRELAPGARRLVPVPVYPVPDPRLPFLGLHLTPTLDGRVEVGPNALLAPHRRAYRRGDPLAAGFFRWRGARFGERAKPGSGHRTATPLRDLVETLTYPGFWRLVRRHGRAGAAELARAVSRRRFLRDVRRLVPGVEAAHLRPGGRGLRAQALDRQGNLVDDFRIVYAERAVHVLNAPSPAATAALAIGREIADMVEGSLR